MKRIIDAMLPSTGLGKSAVAFDSSPTGELAISDVEYANMCLSFNMHLNDDWDVRGKSLAVFLDGRPLSSRSYFWR
jgi:hypothetical protein